MDVSVLGLGRMGSAIAERLIDAGHQVSVWNRSKGKADDLVARGARELDAPVRGLGQLGRLHHDGRRLPGPDRPGARARRRPGPRGAGRGTNLIDMSTVSVQASRDVAAAAEASGVAYLRAPVSGNPGVVRAGNLTILASGDEAVFKSSEALLLDIGPQVFYAGEGDAARVIKLALNLMVAGTTRTPRRVHRSGRGPRRTTGHAPRDRRRLRRRLALGEVQDPAAAGERLHVDLHLAADAQGPGPGARVGGCRWRSAAGHVCRPAAAPGVHLDRSGGPGLHGPSHSPAA